MSIIIFNQIMNKMDFRNNPVFYIEEIFKKNFNNEKINNFKKNFNKQDIKFLNELKGFKDRNKIFNLLPFNTMQIKMSKKDREGNEKFIFNTNDGNLIESVLMPDKKNISVCVSTQIGCKFNCTFCNTGQMGFIRDLLPHEILEQIRLININRIIPEKKRISCISFMGMGEPFDNLKNSMTALDWISSNWGFQISRKKITFSTSGCITFKNFFSYPDLPNLAVSLHSAIESKRRQLLPYAKISLEKLKLSMIEYVERTKKQISIEYCLFKNFNDSGIDAEKLCEYLKGLPCKVNLLHYNKISDCNFNPVSTKAIFNFKKILKVNNIPAIYRKSLGTKINAGCGQLGNNEHSFHSGNK